MSTALSIENLGKRYVIRHQAGVKHQEDALRNALAEFARSSFRSLVRRSSGGAGRREEFWALKDVSFEVGQGERIGIIGRNGTGKSTLLKILSRITEPTTGRVTMRGRVASLLEVGTGFHPELSGRENIFLSGAILGMTRSEIRRKFDEIVDFAEIEKFLDTPVKRYSSGMYVRLAFAVAAHLEPQILLVDEVLAVGDAAFQKKCLGKMGEVAGQGRTVLFVSHNMAAVTQLCTRAVWLEGGQVRESGNAGSVIEMYMSEGSSQLAERRWSYPGDAPGDHLVRLIACRVMQDCEVKSVIDINRPMSVEIDFLVLQPTSNLVSGVSFYNAENTCLFNSCDWRPNDLGPGFYTKSVSMPAQLLAEGLVNVLVQLHFYEPDIKSAVVRDAMSFEAIESDSPLAVRGLYKEAWPGVMRIRLPWTDSVRIEDDGAVTLPSESHHAGMETR